MQYQPSKAKTLTFLIISVAIFLGLFLLGTFLDLQISQALTVNSLTAGEYYSHSLFALGFEIFGSCPIWLALALAFLLATSMTAKRENLPKWQKWAICICTAVTAWVVLLEMTKDIFYYLLEHLEALDFFNQPMVKTAQIFFATVIWVLFLLCLKNCKNDQKLWRFALVIVCSCALYILVGLIKTPVGRVRFRTISVLGDLSLYTPWYKINGSQAFDGLPGDCCKSFPSGHTFSAGMVFLLLCLPDLFDFAKKKWFQVILWVVSISYTLTVGVSRIVAGAHYLTDVVFSMGLSLFGVLLFREIFLTGFANLKALNKKRRE